ncbi:MAG: hypothetical protein AB7G93_05620 [Bdellovibrionales bacterium]
MPSYIRLLALLVCALLEHLPAHALEVQGFLTSDCQRQVGVIIHVDDNHVEFLDLEGRHRQIARNQVNALYVYNVIDNPIPSFHVDPAAALRLRAVYLDDGREPLALAFAVRFIENLVIFYSLEGRTHVHEMGDIFKLRPAPPSSQGVRKANSHKRASFEFPDVSIRCPAVRMAVPSGMVKPTRVLSDKIGISDFFQSFQQGYENLESFQERTYLYARPFLFERKARLGLVVSAERDESTLELPLYFQWATGEPYRFQSFTVIGQKSHEFLPNAEPVFSLRSDVKSHIFHALFIGNVAGVPAGNSVFLKNDLQPFSSDLTVQPSFNYLAMMGGDYGPYSLSVGLFYNSFGIRVRDEYREVRGGKPSYAVRAMYTTRNLRLRAIGSLTDYEKSSPTEEDVIARTDESGARETVQSFEFSSRFLRAGADYEFSPRLSASLDGIWVSGNYKDVRSGQPNDIRFNRFTVQGAITQSFSDYVSMTGYMNLIQHTFESNFSNRDNDREQRETRFFGTFEFIF